MSQILFMDMLDGIVTEIPECPTPVAERAMKMAVIDWFRDTLTWEQDLSAFLTVDGLLRYPLILPECAELVQVEDLLKDSGEPLIGPNWTVRLPRTLIFDSQPPADIRLTPHAFLMPSPGAVGIDCDMDRWRFEWEYGALALLRDQKSRPWYDPNEAQKKRAQFRAEIANARRAQNVGHRSGDLMVRPRPLI